MDIAPMIGAADAAAAGSSLPPGQVAKIRKAADDFEAMAIGQLLQPMFATVDPSRGPFGGGAGEAAWKPMFIDAIGKRLAEHGGIGLAEPVFQEMLRAQEARSATTAEPTTGEDP